MTKVRTVVPQNAKPGQSIIQVVNPSTGKPVRVQVPKDSIPGQMVELDLADGPDIKQSSPDGGMATGSGRNSRSQQSQRSPSRSATASAATTAPDSSAPVASVPTPTQLPTPPPFAVNEGPATIRQHNGEDQPLLEGSSAKKDHKPGCCGACISSPAVLFKSLFQ